MAVEEVEMPGGLLMAKQFAEWGWKVIPCFVSKTGDKVPLIRDWVNEATVDGEVLDGWWREWRWAHPGLVSGVGGCLVIDADGRSAVDWLRELSSSTGGIGNTLCYSTPGRGEGLHLVGSWPTWLSESFRQAKVRGRSGEVQIRGTGHFTLAIGAKRPDGEYVLKQAPTGNPGEIPRALLEAIFEHAVVGEGNSYGGSGLEEVSPATAWELAPLQDGRKNCLAGLAWYLAIRGGTESEVLAECIRFSEEVCSPPLDDELVRRKVEYTYERAAKKRDQAEQQMKREIEAGKALWANRR